MLEVKASSLPVQGRKHRKTIVLRAGVDAVMSGGGGLREINKKEKEKGKIQTNAQVDHSARVRCVLDFTGGMMLVGLLVLVTVLIWRLI